MIQDIFPHKLNNAYVLGAKPAPDDSVLIFKNGEVAVKIEEDTHSLVFPKAQELDSAGELTYLFSVDEQQFFLSLDAKAPSGYEFQNVRAVREEKPQPAHLVYALFTAKHLADWYRDTTYCGRCGGKMQASSKERAMTCPACSYTAYPRIMPAVIVGVTHGDEIILTRYRTGFRHNALIAGFTEIGETAEQTVEREVMEEVGLKVKNIRYYKSQPWGVANNMLYGYFCEVDGDSTIKMDANELKLAQWTRREDIQLQPDDLSLTNEMMKMFKEGKI